MDADTLVLKRTLGPARAIPLSSVIGLQVSQLRRREKHAFIGGGVGALVGWLTGLVVTSKMLDLDPLVGKSGVSTAGAVAGAFDGALIGAGGKPRGAAIGFLVGGISGILYGMAGHPGLPHTGDMSPEMEHIPTFAIAGATCGAIVSPGEAWESIHLPLRVAALPHRNGHVALSIEF